MKKYIISVLAILALANSYVSSASTFFYANETSESVTETMTGEFVAKEDGTTLIGILKLYSDGKCTLKYLDDEDQWRNYSGTYHINDTVRKGMSAVVFFNIPEIDSTEFRGQMWWAMQDEKPSISIGNMIFTLK